MNKGAINDSAVRDFITAKKLRDRVSNIQFRAIVNIQTVKNEITEEMEVFIYLEGFNFGKINLITELNPYIFPTEFMIAFQRMQFESNEYLQINGSHPNKMIGDYEVTITSLGRLKE